MGLKGVSCDSMDYPCADVLQTQECSRSLKLPDFEIIGT